MLSAPSLKPFRSISTHGQVTRLAFCPASKIVYTALDDGSLSSWDVVSGCRIAEVQAHQDYIKDMKIYNDEYLLTASYDSTVKLWRLPEPFQNHVFTFAHDGPVESVDRFPTGHRNFVSSSLNAVYIWDSRSFSLVAKREVHQKTITAVCCLEVASSTFIASCSLDGHLKIMSSLNLDVLHVFGLQHPLFSLHFCFPSLAVAHNSGIVLFSTKKTFSTSPRNLQDTKESPSSLHVSHNQRRQTMFDQSIKDFNFSTALHALFNATDVFSIEASLLLFEKTSTIDQTVRDVLSKGASSKFLHFCGLHVSKPRLSRLLSRFMLAWLQHMSLIDSDPSLQIELDKVREELLTYKRITTSLFTMLPATKMILYNKPN